MLGRVSIPETIHVVLIDRILPARLGRTWVRVVGKMLLKSTCKEVMPKNRNDVVTSYYRGAEFELSH